jgi:uncharacterized membrane protein
MSVEFKDTVEAVGTAVDVAGVVIIVVGALIATAVFGYRMLQRAELHPAYRSYRQGLGRAILLGLELLVAGDIIRTVAIAPTFTSVGVLALIVLVRTFLSFSLEVELEGRWPWQNRGDS